MKKLILILSSLVFLSSCAGVNIKPITIEQNKQMHIKESNLDGYTLYAPKVFLVVKNLKEDCKISTFQIPNYDKPFSLNIESGLGKIDTNIEIKDGWMLGSIKANIDNTSVFSNIKRTFRLSAINENNEDVVICGMKSGIYSLEKTNGNNLQLKQVIISNL